MHKGLRGSRLGDRDRTRDWDKQTDLATGGLLCLHMLTSTVITACWSVCTTHTRSTPQYKPILIPTHESVHS